MAIRILQKLVGHQPVLIVKSGKDPVAGFQEIKGQPHWPRLCGADVGGDGDGEGIRRVQGDLAVIFIAPDR